MIVVETLLGEIFSQIPDVTIGNKTLKVKYHWGGQDDLNLYMRTEAGNKTPLIWLVEGTDSSNDAFHKVERKISLIIAKSSEQKTSRNPVIWNSDFEDILIPLFKNVLKCLNKSGVTTIINGEYTKELRANYSEYRRDSYGKTDTSTKTIDFWNVIFFTANVRFMEKANGELNCINEILF